ncbi:phytanoyl-CoA dioxygenase family protein [Streptomyces scabiei]|uniref:phytanoyl-CoA dioxygenase family protein n=1 Tax=Streptomyces scabiei TaxID=1930 RepID=UPI002FEEB02B
MHFDLNVKQEYRRSEGEGNPAVDMSQAMDDLGVTGDLLDHETVRQLDENGFVILPKFLPSHQVQALRARLTELLVAEGERAGTEVNREPGTMRVSDLVNKGQIFETCFTHPLLLAGVRHVLGEFKLSSLSSRLPLAHEGKQPLHADWRGGAPQPGDYQVFNSLWLLDDFRNDNGATRVVPGSHLWGHAPANAMADPTAPHPAEKLILAPAGSLVMFNGHLWHGGTRNRSGGPRQALHAYFTHRSNAQQLDQATFARPETLAHLSLAARFILDV